MNYQENVEKLEMIVKQLENDDLPLERALELFNDGATIIKQCKTYLEEIKGSVYKVKQDLNSFVEEPIKVKVK
jgi:exodeoxyribonuclease VII small subunit